MKNNRSLLLLCIITASTSSCLVASSASSDRLVSLKAKEAHLKKLMSDRESLTQKKDQSKNERDVMPQNVAKTTVTPETEGVTATNFDNKLRQQGILFK